MIQDNLVGSDIKSSDAIVDSNATKSSDAIVDPSEIKSSDAIVDQPKSSDANRYCHKNNNLSGHIPSGNAPGEAIDCSHSVGIDHQVLHRYFNATTDWQKHNINTKVIEYTDLLVKYLLQRSHYTEGTSLFQFPHYDFDREIGRISVYGSKPKKQESLVQVILNLFKPYNVDITGNNIKQKVSLMTLNFDFDKLIATKNSEDLLRAMYEGINLADPELVDMTPVDIDSLKAFIKANEKLSYQNEKTKRYNSQAKNILMVAEMTGGVFPQIINESLYGRRYYSGRSLQNTSKIVREAALGNHYEYDLNAAVYAIKLNICSYISNKKFTYTSEYIEGGGKFKQSIRENLAQKVFNIDKSNQHYKDRVKKIKDAITAIGFGASITTKGYFSKVSHEWKFTSLREIFSYTIKGDNGKPMIIEMNDGKSVPTLCIDHFVKDPWMSNFIREQKEMSELITTYMKTEKLVTKESHPFLVDGRNAINNNQLMAYVFQTTERNIMNRVQEFIESEGNNVLLRVHDAIFTKEKVNLLELHSMLLEEFVSKDILWLGNKIISFEESEGKAYYYDDELLEHKERIRQEELLAGGTKFKPIVHRFISTQREGYYDNSCDYGQQEYDPENDSYVLEMDAEQRREHYRIVGYDPRSQYELPAHIKQLL